MWKRVLKVLLFAAVLAAVMQAIRLLIIEPDDMAALCEIDKMFWKCHLRDVIIQGFARHLYGPISLIAAALAWLGGIRLFAVLAMVFGMAGAVFYDFEIAAAGLTLGTLLLVHSPGPRDTTNIASVVEQNPSAQ